MNIKKIKLIVILILSLNITILSMEYIQDDLTVQVKTQNEADYTLDTLNYLQPLEKNEFDEKIREFVDITKVHIENYKLLEIEQNITTFSKFFRQHILLDLSLNNDQPHVVYKKFCELLDLLKTKQFKQNFHKFNSSSLSEDYYKLPEIIQNQIQAQILSLDLSVDEQKLISNIMQQFKNKKLVIAGRQDLRNYKILAGVVIVGFFILYNFYSIVLFNIGTGYINNSTDS